MEILALTYGMEWSTTMWSGSGSPGPFIIWMNHCFEECSLFFQGHVWYAPGAANFSYLVMEHVSSRLLHPYLMVQYHEYCTILSWTVKVEVKISKSYQLKENNRLWQGRFLATHVALNIIANSMHLMIWYCKQYLSDLRGFCIPN